MRFSGIKFLTSAATLDQLPVDEGYEVAFAGRSNAGKSSALNVITNVRNLAKTSKTPGRTRLINLFSLDDCRRLVDLPGYGYAQVSRAQQKQWRQTLGDFLVTRRCLRGLILLMDCRHPLKEDDWLMIEWVQQRHLPIHILLTKVDKLSRNQGNQQQFKVEKELKGLPGITCQCFSSLKKTGVEQLEQVLLSWLEL